MINSSFLLVDYYEFKKSRFFYMIFIRNKINVFN